MDHVRQYDWCTYEPDINFLDETTMDNSVIERILRNKFRDPMCSSESEDEERTKIDWNEIFKREDFLERPKRIFVPGLRRPPPHPKLSALTREQHLQLLKVICSEYPTVLPDENIQRPTKFDRKMFEMLSEVYLKEQKEYLNWAKTVWTNIQCVNVLRPKPGIELVYEAEFKIKEKEMSSFPKQYALAAQIPLESKGDVYEFVHKKDLVNVRVNDLPHIAFPELTKKCTILRPCSLPEPCHKHPCKFILPTENSVSILPTTEVHRELAQFALDNGSQYLFSEKALKCMVEMDQLWTLPVSVYEVIGTDGAKNNVLVVGSNFSINRECAQTRTYKAFRHLLENALIPATEKAKELEANATESAEEANHSASEFFNASFEDLNIDSDDEDHLFIDTGDDNEPLKGPRTENDNSINDSDNDEMEIDLSKDDDQSDNEKSPRDKTEKDKIAKNNEKDKSPTDKLEKHKSRKVKLEKGKPQRNKADSDETEKSDISNKKEDFYVCTCEESFYVPPRRSYKKWQVTNNDSSEKYDIIVHCSHKLRGRSGEIILEPIPEYQIDLGATELSDHKIKSLLLSLLLRRSASLMTVRIDGPTGDIVTFDNVSADEYIKIHADHIPSLWNTIYTAVDQLQGLLPGHYILQHEPSHGTNALLYATRIRNKAQCLALNFDCSQLAETDEAQSVKTPPKLGPILLPCHKFRRILPCAFTPYANEVAKETKKTAARQKTPPQAIKWPKRRLRKRNKKKNN